MIRRLAVIALFVFAGTQAAEAACAFGPNQFTPVYDTASGLIKYCNGTTITSATLSGVSAGGSDTQVLYNNGGAMAGNANFTWTNGTSTLTVTGIVSATTLKGSLATTYLSGALPAANFPAMTGDVTNTAGSLATTIAANAVSNAKMATMANNTIKGNISGGAAVPSDLTATQTTAFLNAFTGDSGSGGIKGLVPAPASGDAAASKFLKADGTWTTVSGTPSGTAGGDLTGTYPNPTVASSAVTNAKMANMANNTIKGNISGGAAAPSDLTATQTTALLNAFTGDSGSGGVKGLVPAPASGDAAASKFLKADGTWATTSAGASGAAGYVQFSNGTSLTSDSTAGGQFFWDSTNHRLGLGTASPTANLHVVGGTAHITLGSSTGTAPAYIQILNGGGAFTQFGTESTAGGAILTGGSANATVLGSNGAYPLQFGTTNTVRVTIDSSGNVGFGTASPAAKVHIYDQNNTGVKFEEYNDNDGANYRNYRAGGTIALPTAITSGLRLASFLASGYYGAGFSGLNGGLSIYASENYSTTSTGGTFLTLSTSANGTNPGGGGTERMRIDSTGNVGIGNTAPAVQFSNKLTTATTNNVVATTQVFAYSTGDMTDGFGPNFMFAIGDSGAPETNIAALKGVRDGSDTSGRLHLGVKNAGVWNEDAMVIKANGNVGIGTAAPLRALDVQGTGLAILGSGSNTELMLRERGGTVRNVGAWHLSVRGDVGGANDDLKFLRFVGGTYTDIPLQISNSTGTVTIPSLNVTSCTGCSGGGPNIAAGDSNITVTDTGTGYETFTLDAGEKMRLTSTGLGIGTSSPSSKLHILTASGTASEIIQSSSGSAVMSLIPSANNLYSYINLGDGSTFGWQVGKDVDAGTLGGANGFYIYENDTGTTGTRLAIAKGGNVGVGTTGPEAHVDIYGASATAEVASLVLKNNATGVGTASALYFVPNTAGALARAASIKSRQTTSGNYADLGFFTSNGTTPAEIMTITAAGKVGIGTSSPVSRLTVGASAASPASGIGSFSIVTNGSYGGGIGLQDGTGNVGMYIDTTGTAFRLGAFGTSLGALGSSVMSILSSGNVGIGTQSPAVPLHVMGSNPTMRLEGAIPSISFKTTATGTREWKWASGYNDVDSISLVDVTASNAQRILVTSTGNVGIGTVSPTTLLDVGNGTTNPVIRINGLNSGTAGGANITFANAGTAIGAIGNYSAIYGGSFSNIMTFYTPNNASFPAGNVGIGTTTPGQKLTVAGNMSTSILYDYDNTAYYIDPANTSLVSTLYRSYGYNGVEYDANNSAYYVDPSSVSIFNDMRANIYYDFGNTSYYLDPASTSNLNAVTAASLTGTDVYTNGGWLRINTGGTGIYWQTYGKGLYMADSTYIRSYAGTESLLFPGFYHSSDRRLKHDIKAWEGDAFAAVRAINVVNFKWNKDNKQDFGVIAQDVVKFVPEIVNTDPSTGMMTVQYDKLVLPVIDAVKKLIDMVEGLETKVTQLFDHEAVTDKRLDALEAQMKALKAENDSLKATNAALVTKLHTVHPVKAVALH